MKQSLFICRLSRFHGFFHGILLLLLCFSAAAVANNSIPKLVYLIFDEDKVIASNIELNRFDELSLNAKEEVISHEVGNAVAVVVTNSRIMAYSISKSGWVIKETQANETIQSVTAEDYSALIVTSKRFLSFNGKTGLWAETKRKKIFK